MRPIGIVNQCRSKVCSATIMPSTSIAAVAGGDDNNNNNQGSISSRKVEIECCGLSKLLTKLICSKKDNGGGIRISTLLMRNRKSRSRQSSFKCRYDPSSYSLNFDSSSSSTSNSLSSEDDYYYQFCAFSSRFAAAVPRISTVSPSSTLTVAFSR